MKERLERVNSENHLPEENEIEELLENVGLQSEKVRMSVLNKNEAAQALDILE